MSGTRFLIEKSSEAAVRMANTEMKLTCTAPTIAGILLHAADGDARRALSMLPSREGEFWERVSSVLVDVIAEEDSSRGPLLRTANG